MTNKEKFKRIFGFEPNDSVCLLDKSYSSCNSFDYCYYCPMNNWWDKKYTKPKKQGEQDGRN